MTNQLIKELCTLTQTNTACDLVNALEEIHDLRALTEDDLEREFVNMINDCYAPIDICGFTYAPAPALKAVDEIAYNEELYSYISGELEDRLTQIDSYFFETEALEALCSELAEGAIDA